MTRHDAGPSPDPDAMSRLRERLLTARPAELGIEVLADGPCVYGVVMDFYMDDVMITVISLSDGHASLYTTSGFGVIGGGQHESVQEASYAFVEAANNWYEQSVPASGTDGPPPETVRFRLLTPDGVRIVDGAMDAIEAGRHTLSELFGYANDVMTELRLLTESAEQADQRWSSEHGYASALLTAMSEGGVTSVEIRAGDPIPDLMDLIPIDNYVREWVQQRELQYDTFDAGDVIRVIGENCDFIAGPSGARISEVPTVQDLREGGVVARIIDVRIGRDDRWITLKCAAADDPRVIALQVEAESQIGATQDASRYDRRVDHRNQSDAADHLSQG